MKRADYISWDEYFMGIAMLAAKKQDPILRWGLIVSPDNIIISTGYNGMPKWRSDTNTPGSGEGAQTNIYVVQAELNAISNANGRIWGQPSLCGAVPPATNAPRPLSRAV